MQSVLFLHPETGPRALYLNPIEAQRLAASVAKQFPLTSVKLLDLNAVDDQEEVPRAIRTCDILCLSLPSGSMPAALELVSIGKPVTRAWLVFFGEIVSDGNPLHVLTMARERGWDARRMVAFLGREESQFLHVVSAIACNASPRQLPSVIFLPSANDDAVVDDNVPLPETVPLTASFFPASLREAVEARGLRVLLDGLSRGCEHHCLYCHLNNRRQTSGVVQSLVGDLAGAILDLESWCDSTVLIQFTDENFFGGPSSAAIRTRLKHIQQLALQLKQRNFKGTLGVDTRVDTVICSNDDLDTKELRRSAWHEFRAAGLGYVYLGTESFSPSQLKRYGKSVEPKLLSDVLSFLRLLKMQFTAGLIILDPLVVPSEIAESIDFLERNDLLGNAASLLKEMRLQTRSKYYQLLEKRKNNLSRVGRDMLMLIREEIPYAHPIMQNVVPITRVVHSLFADSGYRHSDVAAFEALVPEVANNEEDSVPKIVTQMEACLLKELVLVERPVDVSWICGLVEDCADKVLKITERRRMKIRSMAGEKVHRYYGIVFSEIKRRIASLRQGDLH